MKKKIKELQSIREYNVVKNNDLIQKSRYNLSTQEQKIILYLISKVKPDDSELKLYDFHIKNFCEVCGIDMKSGKNYSMLKCSIKDLADKSMWVKIDDDGTETLLRWIEKPYMNENSGKIEIKLDKDMKPYLLRLKEQFTSYALYFTLAMQSKYSIRLYELLKSYEYQKGHEFEIEDLKKRLFAETYNLFGDFKRKVLTVSIKEINDFSDISVTYTLEKQGRRFHKIKFTITPKSDIDERMRTFSKIDKILNPDNKKQL